jgi:hypothetical protein
MMEREDVLSPWTPHICQKDWSGPERSKKKIVTEVIFLAVQFSFWVGLKLERKESVAVVT